MPFRLNLNRSTPWVLVDLDSGKEIVGPFPPTSLSRNVAAEIGTATSLGRQHPIVQWLGGSAETVTFEATLYAETTLDRVEDKVEELLALARRREALGRPPVVQLVHGSLSFRALVRELGGIRYGDLRPDGTYRRVDFAITLVRYEPVDVVATDPTAPEPSTRFHVAADGETWESVARDEYGEPMLGVKLRDLHPEFGDLAPGDLVKLLPREHSALRGTVALDAIPLADTEEARALRLAAFEDVAARYGGGTP